MSWGTADKAGSGQRAGGRGLVERLLERAAHLEPEDRRLVEQVLDAGESLRNLAARHRVPPRNLQRRYRNTLRRLASPEFIFIARFADRLPPRHRRAAQLIYLRGFSQRRTADAAGLSLHEVRQAVRAVQTLARL